jgi:hypothetical protein
MPSAPSLQACEKIAVALGARYIGSQRASWRALLQRPRPPVLTVELKPVESVEDHLAVIGAAMEFVEDRQAVAIAPHRLPVDHRLGEPGAPTAALMRG